MIGAGALVLPGAQVPDRTLVPAGRTLSEMTAPLVIAEAGVNHNGDLAPRARHGRGGCRCWRRSRQIPGLHAQPGWSRAARRPPPIRRANTGKDDQISLLDDLELSRDDFAVLAEDCRRHRIGFLATAFDVEIVEALIGMGMDRIKVASGEITNTPALRRFAQLGMPVLLSTGMATMDEVGAAVETLQDGRRARHHAAALHVALSGAQRRRSTCAP